MKLDINDIILIHSKAFSNDRKVADKWEQSPYRVVEQVGNHPVFKVQNMENHHKIRMLHCNMLYPLKSAQNESTEVIVEQVHTKLCSANEAMLLHFHST